MNLRNYIKNKLIFLLALFLVGSNVSYPILEVWYRLQTGALGLEEEASKLHYSDTKIWSKGHLLIWFIPMAFTAIAFLGYFLCVNIFGRLFNLESVPIIEPNINELRDDDDEIELQDESASIREQQLAQILAGENGLEKRLRLAGYTGPLPEEFICPVSGSLKEKCYLSITQEDNNEEPAANYTYDENTMLQYTAMDEEERIDPINRKPIEKFVRVLELERLVQQWVAEKELQKRQELDLIIRSQIPTQANLRDAQKLFNRRRPTHIDIKSPDYEQLRRSV